MMNKRSIFSILVFFLPFLCLYAESDKKAEKIVNNLVEKLYKNSIKADFKLTISEDDQILEEENGEFVMQNNKFSMSTESLKVFFDGKTLWSYMVSNNEVNITEPTEDQLGDINPIFMLNKYQPKCIFNFSKDNHSRKTNVIEMSSKDVDVEFKEIIIVINKSTNQIISIQQNNKDGYSLFVEFLNFEEKAELNDSNFVFDKSKYKNIYENDLR